MRDIVLERKESQADRLLISITNEKSFGIPKTSFPHLTHSCANQDLRYRYPTSSCRPMAVLSPFPELRCSVFILTGILASQCDLLMIMSEVVAAAKHHAYVHGRSTSTKRQRQVLRAQDEIHSNNRQTQLSLDLVGTFHANLPRHHLHFSSIIMPKATLVISMNEIDSNLGA